MTNLHGFPRSQRTSPASPGIGPRECDRRLRQTQEGRPAQGRQAQGPVGPHLPDFPLTEEVFVNSNRTKHSRFKGDTIGHVACCS